MKQNYFNNIKSFKCTSPIFKLGKRYRQVRWQPLLIPTPNFDSVFVLKQQQRIMPQLAAVIWYLVAETSFLADQKKNLSRGANHPPLWQTRLNNLDSHYSSLVFIPTQTLAWLCNLCAMHYQATNRGCPKGFILFYLSLSFIVCVLLPTI